GERTRAALYALRPVPAQDAERRKDSRLAPSGVSSAARGEPGPLAVLAPDRRRSGPPRAASEPRTGDAAPAPGRLGRPRPPAPRADRARHGQAIQERGGAVGAVPARPDGPRDAALLTI